jgi:hypothetical protein
MLKNSYFFKVRVKHLFHAKKVGKMMGESGSRTEDI